MSYAAMIQKLDNVVRETAFSGVIAISCRGESVYECASGYADRTHKVQNTLETRFGIASGTKFFTALAIGKLIEMSKLTLTTKLSELLVLPFKHYAPEISIQHLLTHTSGIPDYFDEELIDDFDNFKVAIPWSELKGPRDYLPVFPDEPMKFQPGARFSYSNGGYILLGIIIESLSGMAYRDFVTQEIFKAAGMQQSGYFAFNSLPENTAYGYIELEQGWRTNIYNLPVIGASDGGAYTTARDLTLMWDAFWDGKILSPELVDIFAQPFSTAQTEGENRFYGHGIWIYQTSNVHEEYITGCDAGVSFESGVIRNKNIQLSVLSNTTSGAWSILRALDPYLGKG